MEDDIQFRHLQESYNESQNCIETLKKDILKAKVSH